MELEGVVLEEIQALQDLFLNLSQPDPAIGHPAIHFVESCRKFLYAWLKQSFNIWIILILNGRPFLHELRK